MAKKKLFIFHMFLIMSIVSFSQPKMQEPMHSIAVSLIENLKREDSISILNMFDSSYVDFSNVHKREFIKESISIEIRKFNKLLKRELISNQLKFIFSKDSSTQANMLTIPLMAKEDERFNLKRCDLVLVFLPDKYFNNASKKFLNFYLVQKQIKDTGSNEIKLPPKLQK